MDSIFSSAKSQKEIKHTIFFFRAVTVSFAHLHWMHRLKGQCAHSDHFSTPPRGRDALNGCPGSRWMGIISTQNSNTATIANPHLSAPKMNSEITDLKSDHLILIPPLCIHGLCLHRSTDPKLLSNRTPAFLWAWNILRLRLWKTGKNCNCKLRLIGCSAQMQGYNSTISQPLWEAPDHAQLQRPGTAEGWPMDQGSTSQAGSQRWQLIHMMGF